MESTNQLDIINFGSLQVRVYGTEDEPMIKCSDLLIHVLDYKQSKDARWFREMSQELKLIYLVQDHGTTPCFNEQGVYWALMKSNKPIAQQFQLAVCNWLKQMRMQRKQILTETQKQLEEAKKEIEELKAPQKASIYKIKQGNRLLYVGKDKSKAQNRPQQHLTERRKIVQNYQLIDIYLATMNEQDITFEFMPCLNYEADELEKETIETHHPEFNQSMNSNSYICNQCDPQKIYKHRGNYEKHLLEKHQ